MTPNYMKVGVLIILVFGGGVKGSSGETGEADRSQSREKQ